MGYFVINNGYLLLRNNQPYEHPLYLRHIICRREKVPHQNIMSCDPKTTSQEDKHFAHTSVK